MEIAKELQLHLYTKLLFQLGFPHLFQGHTITACQTSVVVRGGNEQNTIRQWDKITVCNLVIQIKRAKNLVCNTKLTEYC